MAIGRALAIYRSDRDPVPLIPGGKQSMLRDGMEDVCRTDHWLCST